jgi:hypothetical protein
MGSLEKEIEEEKLIFRVLTFSQDPIQNLLL